MGIHSRVDVPFPRFRAATGAVEAHSADPSNEARAFLQGADTAPMPSWSSNPGTPRIGRRLGLAYLLEHLREETSGERLTWQSSEFYARFSRPRAPEQNERALLREEP